MELHQAAFGLGRTQQEIQCGDVRRLPRTTVGEGNSTDDDKLPLPLAGVLLTSPD